MEASCPLQYIVIVKVRLWTLDRICGLDYGLILLQAFLHKLGFSYWLVCLSVQWQMIPRWWDTDSYSITCDLRQVLVTDLLFQVIHILWVQRVLIHFVMSKDIDGFHLCVLYHHCSQCLVDKWTQGQYQPRSLHSLPDTVFTKVHMQIHRKVVHLGLHLDLVFPKGRSSDFYNLHTKQQNKTKQNIALT